MNDINNRALQAVTAFKRKSELTLATADDTSLILDCENQNGVARSVDLVTELNKLRRREVITNFHSLGYAHRMMEGGGPRYDGLALFFNPNLANNPSIPPTIVPDFTHYTAAAFDDNGATFDNNCITAKKDIIITGLISNMLLPTNTEIQMYALVDDPLSDPTFQPCSITKIADDNDKDLMQFNFSIYLRAGYKLSIVVKNLSAVEYIGCQLSRGYITSQEA